MILDEIKRDCIALIAEGHTITEVARRIDKSRQTIYEWMKDEDFKAELDRLLQQIKVEGERKIIINLDKYISNIAYLANNAKSEKTKLEASCYLTDRVLGRPTSKIDAALSNNQGGTNKIDPDVLDEEINQWEAELLEGEIEKEC